MIILCGFAGLIIGLAIGDVVVQIERSIWGIVLGALAAGLIAALGAVVGGALTTSDFDPDVQAAFRKSPGQYGVVMGAASGVACFIVAMANPEAVMGRDSDAISLWLMTLLSPQILISSVALVPVGIVFGTVLFSIPDKLKRKPEPPEDAPFG